MWCLQPCSLFSRLIWLFAILHGSIWIFELFFSMSVKSAILLALFCNFKYVKYFFWVYNHKIRVKFYSGFIILHCVEVLRVHAKWFQWSLALCGTLDCSLPGSSVCGILWAGLGCQVLLWGVFLTQGLNPCLLCLLHYQTVSGYLSLMPTGKPIKSSSLGHLHNFSITLFMIILRNSYIYLIYLSGYLLEMNF